MKLFLPALAIALAAPAVAQDATQTPAASSATTEAATAAEDTSQNRMICKKEKSTGSRLRAGKVCMTAAQWAARQREERQATERSQTQRQTFQ